MFAGETRRRRSSSADISADAEISASGAAGDAELFHSGLERRPFHAEAGRGAQTAMIFMLRLELQPPLGALDSLPRVLAVFVQAIGSLAN